MVKQAVRAVEKEGVDFLVDMNGYTQHGRPEILAARPAACLCVGLLGFAASLGPSLTSISLGFRV